MAALRDYIKVYFVDDVNHRIGYCASHKDWDKFRDAIHVILPGTNLDDYRIYWIDDEDEQIEIIDSQTLDIFWLGSEGKKKVFVEKRAVEPSTKGTNVFIPTTEEYDGSKENQSHFPVHPKVICDGCNRQVVGYRYKCVQCPDFDLCMTCESKMKHKEHVMFRIPSPLDKIRFDRRTLKEMKKGKFGSMEYERNADHRHSHRTHERKDKKHRVSGCNMATHFYNMMNDLAEGTEGPIEIPIDIEIRTSDNAENNEPKTTREPNTEKTKKSTPPVSVLPPNLENILHQPMNYLNAGMEMLHLFNQMFANMSGPTNGNGTPNATTTHNEESSAPSATTKETQPNCDESKKETEKSDKDVVSEEVSKGAVPKIRTTPEKETTTPEKETTTPEKETTTPVKETSMENKNDGMNLDKDIQKQKELQEVSSNTNNKKEETIPVVNKPEIDNDSKSEEKANDPRKSPSFEDWTMIGKQNEELQNPEQRRKSDEKSLSENDYIKLSHDLKKHMEAETSLNTEKRAEIVYHQKKHINEAVISMISMGFSNDGKYLTNLLETVDGDISAALELLNHENN